MPSSVMNILLGPWHIVSDMIEKGGFFVIFIFLCGLLLWTFTIERFWYFSRVLPKEALSIDLEGLGLTGDDYQRLLTSSQYWSAPGLGFPATMSRYAGSAAVSVSNASTR